MDKKKRLALDAEAWPYLWQHNSASWLYLLREVDNRVFLRLYSWSIR